MAFEFITSGTATVDVASLSITGIPDTYKHLIFYYAIKHTTQEGDLFIKFDDATGSSFDVYGKMAGIKETNFFDDQSFETTSEYEVHDAMAGEQDDPDFFTTGYWELLHYASSDIKGGTWEHGYASNLASTPTDDNVLLVGGHWLNTTTAITGLTFSVFQSGIGRDITAGSEVQVYGLVD